MKYVMYLGLVLLAIAIGVGGYFGYQFLEGEKEELEQAKQESAAEQDTTLGRIKAELAKNSWTSGAVKTEFDEATGTLTIIDDTDPSAGLDEEVIPTTPEQVLQQTYNLYVRAGMAVFGNVSEVENLVVVRKIPLNRGTGIVSVTEIANIKTSKDKFNEIDWESLEGKPIYQEVDESAENLKLDTGFARNIRNANMLILLPEF